MTAAKVRTYSPYVYDATVLLGQLVKLGRKQRRWTEQELAERAGISRGTLKKIEKGDLKCEIGLVFEVAALTGVSLFEAERSKLMSDIDLVSAKLALLPKSIRAKRVVDDDF